MGGGGGGGGFNGVPKSSNYLLNVLLNSCPNIYVAIDDVNRYKSCPLLLKIPKEHLKTDI